MINVTSRKECEWHSLSRMRKILLEKMAQKFASLLFLQVNNQIIS